MKTCGECKWFIPLKHNRRFGRCKYHFEIPKFPVCYQIKKMDVWVRDCNCVFWEETK